MTTKTDLMKEFREYRDQAMARTTSNLAHPTFTDHTQLRDLLAREWPEAAQVPDDQLLFRQVGHGHQAGALVELMYQVGNDAIGRRYLDLYWVDDETGWRWLMSLVGR